MFSEATTEEWGVCMTGVLATMTPDSDSEDGVVKAGRISPGLLSYWQASQLSGFSSEQAIEALKSQTVIP